TLFEPAAVLEVDDFAERLVGDGECLPPATLKIVRVEDKYPGGAVGPFRQGQFDLDFRLAGTAMVNWHREPEPGVALRRRRAVPRLGKNRFRVRAARVEAQPHAARFQFR